MEAVAAHALGIEAAPGSHSGPRARRGRDGRRCRSRRPAAAPGMRVEQRADGREIVRLVQRRQRNVAFEPSEHVVVDQDRPVVFRAAVDHAMPDRDRSKLLRSRAASRQRSQAQPATSAICIAARRSGRSAASRRPPSARSRGRVPMPSIWPLIRRCQLAAVRRSRRPGT